MVEEGAGAGAAGVEFMSGAEGAGVAFVSVGAGAAGVLLSGMEGVAGVAELSGVVAGAVEPSVGEAAGGTGR